MGGGEGTMGGRHLLQYATVAQFLCRVHLLPGDAFRGRGIEKERGGRGALFRQEYRGEF